MNAADRFSDDPKVEFAAVDCTTFQTLCTTNDVSGYPTFKYFNYYKNTKPYNGGRTVSIDDDVYMFPSIMVFLHLVLKSRFQVYVNQYDKTNFYVKYAYQVLILGPDSTLFMPPFVYVLMWSLLF